jgi:hypothetical protein
LTNIQRPTRLKVGFDFSQERGRKQMPLRVQCSAGHLMMVPDHRAGTVLRCPNCGIDVQVPPAAGTTGKEIAKPRITTPVIARNEAKPGAGPAARQSPQVAGHSTAANSGIGLPALSKPAKLRVKPSPAAVESAKPKKPDETAIVARKAAPELPVEPPVESPPIATEATSPAVEKPPPPPVPPAESPEIVFTTPVITAPKPIAIKPDPAIDQTTVETVQLPPKKIAKPAAEDKPAAPAPATPKSSRQTLTGTIIVAAEPDGKPVELFEIKDEPEPPPAPSPLPATIIEPPIAQPSLDSAVPAPAMEPEPAPPPMTILQGVRPTISQRHTTWQLAAALAAAALLSIGPAVWEITDYLRSDSGPDVAHWAFLLLMFGMVQFASIILLVQVPDWSSIWIVTLQSLGFAAMYAAVLGLTIITKGNSSLIDTLQLGQQYSGNKAQPWCVCLAATYACIAFFAGRISAKWLKVQRQVQAAEQSAAHA